MGEGFIGILAGLGMGLTISILGAGGSIFIVPVLILLFTVEVEVATGTSLAVVFAAAFTGAVGHGIHGHVRGRVVVLLGGAALLGALLGPSLQPLVSRAVSGRLFACALAIAAYRMLRDADKEVKERTEVSTVWLFVLGVLVGVVNGFLGVGGGFIILPVLLWGARLELRDAIGTSLAVIAASCAGGVIGHAVQGHISLDLIITVGLGATLGAVLGAPLCGKIPERPIRVAFGILAALLAIYLFACGWQRPDVSASSPYSGVMPLQRQTLGESRSWYGALARSKLGPTLIERKVQE